MKKFFINPYFDKALTSIIALGMAASIYFIVDVRDFVKYKQPYKDSEQDKRIQNVYDILVMRISYTDSMTSEKINNLHKRIDNILNKIN